MYQNVSSQINTNTNKNTNRLMYIVAFLAICVVYAFSNLRGLSIAMQFVFVIMTLINVIATKKIKLSIHFLWMFLFITWGLFTTLFAYNQVVSLNEVVNLALKLLFYTSLIMFIENESKFNFILKSIAFSGLILTLRVVFFTPLNDWGTERLGTSIDLNPNALGISIAYACIASIYLGKVLNKKYYYLLSIPLIVIGLLTGSRKAFIAIAGGVAILFFLRTTKTSKKVLSLVVSVLLIWILFEASMSIPLLYDVLGVRLEGLVNLTDSGVVDKSTQARSLMIKEAWELFKQNPFTGYGFENFSFISSFGGYSHNNYMELLISTGVIGTVIYYSLPIMILIYSILNRKNTNYSLIIAFLVIIFIMDIANVAYRQLLTQVVIAVCTSRVIMLRKEKLENTIMR